MLVNQIKFEGFSGEMKSPENNWKLLGELRQLAGNNLPAALWPVSDRASPPSTVDSRETFGQQFRRGRRPSPSASETVTATVARSPVPGSTTPFCWIARRVKEPDHLHDLRPHTKQQQVRKLTHSGKPKVRVVESAREHFGGIDDIIEARASTAARNRSPRPTDRPSYQSIAAAMS
jgi:hypothetical protein